MSFYLVMRDVDVWICNFADPSKRWHVSSYQNLNGWVQVETLI